MTLRIFFATVLLIVAGAAYAQETEVQRRACRPEVFRLCSKWIPNRDAISHCLMRKIGQLIPDCRAVMEGRLK